MRNFTSLVLHETLQPLMDFPRWIKRSVSILIDCFILFSSWVLAYYLRYDSFELVRDESFVLSFMAVTLATIVVFSLLGLYRAVVRFIGLRSMATIAVGTAASGILLHFAIDANAFLYSLTGN
ncbi:MAG: polysaccharide biosynthesis protein, partial [Pararheinheimera sp.]|nr:polysaccharide biosynthesis protein [Rheinheimera sp.]